MSMNSEPVAIGDLLEGDYFFYSTTEERQEQEASLLKLIADLEEEQLSTMDSRERAEFYKAQLSGYQVIAVCRETGERCTRRMSDGTNHVWYDGNIIVNKAQSEGAFMALLRMQKVLKKQVEARREKLQKARSKSKKKNKVAEVIANT